MPRETKQFFEFLLGLLRGKLTLEPYMLPETRFFRQTQVFGSSGVKSKQL